MTTQQTRTLWVVISVLGLLLCVVMICDAQLGEMAARTIPTSTPTALEEALVRPFVEFIRASYGDEQDTMEVKMEVLATRGDVACASASYFYLYQYYDPLLRSYQHKETPVFGTEMLSFAIRFIHEDEDWQIDEIHATGCARCNNSGWEVQSAYEICPIPTEPSFWDQLRDN